MDELSADRLYQAVGESFGRINDGTLKTPIYSTKDVLLSGQAIFSQKYPSFLSFEEDLAASNAKTQNLKMLMGIGQIPSDTQTRERIDRIDPSQLRPTFVDIHNLAKEAGVYEAFKFNDKFLLAVDGTGFYSSNNVSCEHCMTKKHSSGSISYGHQALGIVMIHPDLKQVLPFAPEFISNQDGHQKNDSERNAAKRLLVKTRAENPNMPIIIVEDGLSSNGPHIELLQELNMGFILGAKPGDHKLLFENIENARQDGTLETFIVNKDNTKYEAEILNDTGINASTQIRINFIQIKVTNKNAKKTTFSWVTDQELNRDTWFPIMRAGRCRWKIENETFNTLKNQGYHFEHNYGHGYKHLCNNFGTLMFLQFLLDQLMELSWLLFQVVRNMRSSRKAMWDHIRTLFFFMPLTCWNDLFLILSGKLQIGIMPVEPDTC